MEHFGPLLAEPEVAGAGSQVTGVTDNFKARCREVFNDLPDLGQDAGLLCGDIRLTPGIADGSDRGL